MIHGLDINAEYQEQAQYNRFISWPALKADPLNFRFIWIKVSEGGENAAYVEGAMRCVAGANSVGFEAVNPYHYYLHLWYGQIMSAPYQAQAFYDAAQAAGFGKCHPMTDLEDPQIEAPCTFTDTESANRALTFARNLNKNLRAYHEAIAALFGVKPDIYTGKWWLDYWVPLLIGNGYGSELAWMNDYRFILADYDGTLNIPDYIPADHVIAWQKTSSPIPPVQGIPTGRAFPGDALDIDQWMLSEAEFDRWCGKEQTTMTDANLITLTQDDAHISVDVSTLGVDGAILTMGGEAGHAPDNKPILTTDSGFATRRAQFEAAGLPMIARYDLAPEYWLGNQYGLDVLQRQMSFDNIRDNFSVKHLLDLWADGIYGWDEILAGKAKFKGLSGIELGLFLTQGWVGQTANDIWVTATFEHVATPLKTLMDKGLIPVLPIRMYTYPAYLQTYQSSLYGSMQNRKSWLGLHYAQWTQTNTGQMADVKSILPYAPQGAFRYAYMPDNFTAELHEWTSSIPVPQITDSAGKPRPVTLSTFAGSKEAMYKIFVPVAKITTEPPPVEPPPTGEPDPFSVLQAAVAGLTVKVEAQSQIIAALQAGVNDLADWARGVNYQGPG